MSSNDGMSTAAMLPGFAGCDFASGLFLPASAIKEARRLAVAALMEARQHARGGPGSHRAGGPAGEAEQSCEAVLESLLGGLRHGGLPGPLLGSHASRGPGSAAIGGREG